MRALDYFYLVNLFGKVPLAVSKDYQRNALLPRSDTTLVYEQILEDLSDAVNFLSNQYLDGNLQPYAGDAEKVRPTKWAAKALLSRVYLYLHDYEKAAGTASEIISNNSYFTLDSLADVFLKNSKEAIFQIAPADNDQYNSQEGHMFVLPPTGPNANNNENPAYLSSQLLNSFEEADRRRVSWVDSVTVEGTTYRYAHKYKSSIAGAPRTEYSMVLRLAEQYLIRAEARAQQGDLAGALEDLNAIRSRAGLLDFSSNNANDIIDAIMHERQVELLTEMGHRWFDLKRTGRVDAVMTIVTPSKGGNWEPTDKLYPIPFDDIKKDPNLDQNPGYN
jgi:hypothetical protein